MGNELKPAETGALVAALQDGAMTDLLKPLTREIHLFDTFVAGTALLQDPSVLQTAAVGDRLSLRREDSRFDDNAVAVFAKDGRKLGYVPEKDGPVFARLMDAGKLLAAAISGVDRKGSFTQIAIRIFLVDF